MGMIAGLIALIGGFIFAIVGGVIGWRAAKESKWKVLVIILGILVGAVLGFIAGFGLGFLLISQQM